MSLIFWVYFASNLVVLLLGGLITGLSVLAYRRNRGRPFLLSAVGFALITAGSLTDAVSDLIIFDDFTLTVQELLVLRACAGTFTALGLGVLFYAISRS